MSAPAAAATDDPSSVEKWGQQGTEHRGRASCGSPEHTSQCDANARYLVFVMARRNHPMGPVGRIPSR